MLGDLRPPRGGPSLGRFTLVLGLGAPRAVVEHGYGVDASRAHTTLAAKTSRCSGEFGDHGTVEYAGETIVATTLRPATVAGATT